ncbi:MAG: C25 family cysteine peptidase, partial [Candidatus Thermoplasmatota archaeon]|nr:C25 family cysteine peptidase [Candidatus Thermoplasmatota archaeon]
MNLIIAISYGGRDEIISAVNKAVKSIADGKIKEIDENYLQISFNSEESYLLKPGEPMIPRELKRYELPFGVTNIKIETEPYNIQEIELSKEIRPTPVPLPLTPNKAFINKPSKDKTIYNCNKPYPYSWCDYHVGCGINANAEHVTFLVLNIFPLRYNPVTKKTLIAENITIKITYEIPETNIFPLKNTYDLVIITPKKFQNIVQKLVDHKNNFGVKTILKTTQEIYDEYNGLDEPEKIKYFIKDALETWGIKYVLFFGGLKSTIYGKPKDDINHGSIGWYFPVRYSNFQYDGDPSYNFTSDEPGYLCDLYYADIYKEGGVFDNWDSNGNGVFGEWSGEIKDEMDLYPDVAFGRLACTSTKEAKDVVNKIINYEKEPADPLWFNRIIVVSGDGFLDQKDLNIQWDTKGLPDGKYTIFAQASNPDGEKGPINQINITLNKLVETNITFNHDDHLTTGLKYPFPPVAEIVSISEGNILGNTDYTYTPNEGQAYCNDLFWWANISYVDGVLTIRGKSYDPRPYGNLTNLEVWIKNEQGTIVFNDTRINLETYYEGEWVVGEKVLHGRGGALTFMPEYFENNSVFTSNGKWFNQLDVIREFSNGYGLAYFSGHGSPGWWGDHYPGIPGNRRYGQVPGLLVTQFLPYFPFIKFPLLPMKKLSNTNKLPVVCVGGCHNSMFSVSLIPTILNLFIINYMFTYGHPLPECWGWYMVKLPKTGAIATMGNTGFGWGSEGDVCTIGPGDGWLNTEFFRVYGQENQSILGLAYTQAISNYI